MPIGTNELEHAQKIVGAASLIEWEVCSTAPGKTPGIGWEPFAAVANTYTTQDGPFEDKYIESSLGVLWRRPKLVMPKEGP